MKYIHYGHDTFEKEKFEPVKNRLDASKPKGGLWASRVDSPNNWKDWCESNGFGTEKLNTSFMFTLKEDAKVLRITNSKQLEQLPKMKNPLPIPTMWSMIDYEALATEYDALEVQISEDHELYFNLYGWDCDSIVIMNPEVIIQESDK